MNQSLFGKTALVTGGSRGMGKEWARLLLKDQAHVVLWGRDKHSLEEAQKELKEGFPAGQITIGAVDLADQSALLEAAQELKKHQSIDILINNAGLVHRGPFTDVTIDEHREVISVNLLAMITLTHIFLQPMIQRRSGHIVNIASMAGLTGVANMASYTASKWAVLGFTESIRLEMQEAGLKDIKLMSFCPSYVSTGLFAGARPPLLTKWLKASTTVEKAYEGFKKDKAVVVDPEIGWLVPLARTLLPTSINDKVTQLLGVSRSAGR
jgi:short-subunit dehydrogenase